MSSGKPFLGFVGLGVVGGAVRDAFASVFNTIGYDIKTAPDTKEALLTTNAIFLSLPTSTINGVQDQSSLKDICNWLSENSYEGPVVVKSTVTPGTCAQLKSAYGLRIVHNPEFLTAKNPTEDFLNQPAILLAGSPNEVAYVSELYVFILPYAKILHSIDTKVTELAKYTHNLFLATKVGFLNEMYRACEAMGVSYDEVIAHAISQEKIGRNHTKVPNDNQFGFAGQCFPKDIQAFLSWSKTVGLDLAQVNATNEANLKIRPEVRC